VRTADLVRTLGALVGGRAVSTYEDESGEAVDVRVRLPAGLRRDVAQVANLRLSVPIATVRRPSSRSATWCGSSGR